MLLRSPPPSAPGSWSAGGILGAGTPASLVLPACVSVQRERVVSPTQKSPRGQVSHLPLVGLRKNLLLQAKTHSACDAAPAGVEVLLSGQVRAVPSPVQKLPAGHWAHVGSPASRWWKPWARGRGGGVGGAVEARPAVCARLAGRPVIDNVKPCPAVALPRGVRAWAGALVGEGACMRTLVAGAVGALGAQRTVLLR
eukprot:1762003-Rhodomonas_salina.2